jgi:hypothetical protein
LIGVALPLELHRRRCGDVMDKPAGLPSGGRPVLLVRLAGVAMLSSARGHTVLRALMVCKTLQTRPRPEAARIE